MWGKGKCPPDAADRRLAQSTGLGHFACRPVRRGFRLTLQSARQDLLDRGIGEFAWSARTGFVKQTVWASIEIALTPLTYGLLGCRQLGGDG